MPQAPPKAKKAKEVAKAKPEEEKKKEPEATNEEEPIAENGEAKAEDVRQHCLASLDVLICSLVFCTAAVQFRILHKSLFTPQPAAAEGEAGEKDDKNEKEEKAAEQS